MGSVPLRIAVKSGLLLIGSLPAAGLFTYGAVALCFGEKDLPGDDWIIRASFIAAWLALTLYAAVATDAREAFRRTRLAFAGAAILLPVAALVFVITEPPSRDPIFPKTFIFFFPLAAGAVLGAMSWLLARYVPRLGDVKFSVVAGALIVLILAIGVRFAYVSFWAYR